jgi:formate dehydrogenase major subunit
MHIGGFVRRKGNFVITEFIPTDERTTGSFPLIPGRHPRNSSAGRGESRHQRRRPSLADQPLKAHISERMQPGVVYTTFHHMFTGANVVTTEFEGWATGCPEYKVTAVQVALTKKISSWQQHYSETRKLTTQITK